VAGRAVTVAGRAASAAAVPRPWLTVPPWTTRSRQILSTGPMPPERSCRILVHDLRSRDRFEKEVNQLPNPLAIGVTLGGLFLDVVVPRPKPRAGFAHESFLLAPRAGSRTPRHEAAHEEYETPPAAGVRLN